MKQTAVEWFEEKLEMELELYNSEWFKLEKIIEQAKEMEKQQKGYSKIEVELIAYEMVNWTLDNVGNSSVQSGKKFDEVISKFKNK